MVDFTQFLDYLSTSGLDFAATLLSIIFGFLLIIIQFKKYFMYKKEVKNSKEILSMKYRNEDYQKVKGYVPPAQSFKKVVPVYELDETTNELVVVGTKDLQELIQSSRDCGLDVVLERYGVLPEMMVAGGFDAYKQACSSKNVDFDMSDVRDDLAIFSDFSSEVEEMRKRYHMPNASFDEIREYILKLQTENNQRIQEELSKQVKETKKNEV